MSQDRGGMQEPTGGTWRQPSTVKVCVSTSLEILMVLPVVRPLMHGQQKMFLSILEHLRVNTNGNAIHDINSSSVTCDLAVSGMFAAVIIATLFC